MLAAVAAASLSLPVESQSARAQAQASLQPGGAGDKSSGERQFVPVLARAAVAIGVAAVFMETHEDPDNAPSDGPNMIHLRDVPALIETLLELDRVAKSRPVSI